MWSLSRECLFLCVHTTDLRHAQQWTLRACWVRGAQFDVFYRIWAKLTEWIFFFLSLCTCIVWKLYLLLFCFKFWYFTDLYYEHQKIMFYFFHSYLKTEGQIKYILDQKCICVFILFIFVHWCLLACACVYSAQGGQKRAAELRNWSHRWL